MLKEEIIIDNSISGASFIGSNGNDSIFNWGDNVKISFGKGYDTVENGDSYTVKGGSKLKKQQTKYKKSRKNFIRRIFVENGMNSVTKFTGNGSKSSA